MREPISEALRTKINTYLSNRGLQTLPEGTTLLQVVRRAAAHFDGVGNFDVWDA